MDFAPSLPHWAILWPKALPEQRPAENRRALVNGLPQQGMSGMMSWSYHKMEGEGAWKARVSTYLPVYCISICLNVALRVQIKPITKDLSKAHMHIIDHQPRLSHPSTALPFTPQKGR